MKPTALTLSSHLLTEAERFMGYPELVGRAKKDKFAAKIWDERLLPHSSRSLEWIMARGHGFMPTAPRGAGIRVSERSLGFPGSCDSFTFSAKFSGGRLEITTGNYFGQRGGSVHGVHALNRLIKLMGLKIPARTAKLWSLHRLKEPQDSSTKD